MPGPEDRPSFRVFDAWPAIGFALLYLLTLSRALSVTHDSALFLGPIETLHPRLVPNHLWFEPIMASAYQVLMLMWPDIGAQRAAEALNAVAGAMALQAAYVIAVWRIGLERRRAALAVACAGFTYGVWYYSIAIEAYALPLALTAWAFFGLTARTAPVGNRNRLRPRARGGDPVSPERAAVWCRGGWSTSVDRKPVARSPVSHGSLCCDRRDVGW